MKKIITIITLTLAGALSAFAITGAQKDAYVSALNTTFAPIQAPDGKAKYEAALEPMRATVTPIADWALTNPKEFADWAKALAPNYVATLWLVRLNLKNRFPSKEYSQAQDICIFDAESERAKMRKDNSYYNACKAANFTFDGVRMDDTSIAYAAINANDLDTLEKSSPEFLSQFFDRYISVVEKNATKLAPKDAWNKYVQIVLKFTPYKESAPKVKANWARLEANQDAMATIAKQASIISQ